MNPRGKKIAKIIFAALAVVAAFVLLSWVLVPFLTSDALGAYVERARPWGAVVIIAYVLLAHVVAPLAGVPAFLLGVAVFGIWKAMLYIYIGSMLSAALNFWLARRFGRTWVVRLAGKRAMAKIDEFVEISGAGVLTFARLFGLAVFEEISYAAGLTNMDFRTYMVVTASASAVSHAGFAFVFRNTDFSMTQNVFVMLSVLIAVGAAFSFFVHQYLRRKRGSGDSVTSS